MNISEHHLPGVSARPHGWGAGPGMSAQGLPLVVGLVITASQQHSAGAERRVGALLLSRDLGGSFLALLGFGVTLSWHEHVHTHVHRD